MGRSVDDRALLDAYERLDYVPSRERCADEVQRVARWHARPGLARVPRRGSAPSRLRTYWRALSPPGFEFQRRRISRRARGTAGGLSACSRLGPAGSSPDTRRTPFRAASWGPCRCFRGVRRVPLAGGLAVGLLGCAAHGHRGAAERARARALLTCELAAIRRGGSYIFGAAGRGTGRKRSCRYERCESEQVRELHPECTLASRGLKRTKKVQRPGRGGGEGHRRCDRHRKHVALPCIPLTFSFGNCLASGANPFHL